MKIKWVLGSEAASPAKQRMLERAWDRLSLPHSHQWETLPSPHNCETSVSTVSLCVPQYNGQAEPHTAVRWMGAPGRGLDAHEDGRGADEGLKGFIFWLC